MSQLNRPPKLGLSRGAHVVQGAAGAAGPGELVADAGTCTRFQVQVQLI